MCMCVCIYIYIYIYIFHEHVTALPTPPDKCRRKRCKSRRAKPSFIGWSNNHFNNLHSIMSLEANK